MPPSTAVETRVLELIRSLQKKPYLEGFNLVGGTALALQIGHRKSVDIDLFSDFSFNASDLLEQLHQDFNFQLFFTASNTLKGSINSVNVDILAHRYKLVAEPVIVNEVRLASIPDIIAMKLNAISTSGQRSKDFIDIYYLLNRYKVEEMLGFYKHKYNQENTSFILKSLVYFEDVDLTDWPVLVQDPGLKWAEVKKRIEKEVLEYAKRL
jgi:hypothetical protein